jgi:23S rRNA (adenine2503-C2)-methyltransferase
MKNPRLSLYDLTPNELESFFLSIGEPAYRAKQVVDFLYRHPVASFDDFTSLSKSLREKLASSIRLAPLILRTSLKAPDGTVKNAYEVTGPAGKGAFLESVWMPAEPTDIVSHTVPRGKDESVGLKKPRYTLCISSQLGCAAGCKFCATGAMGLKGQLTAGEIVYQIVHSRITHGEYPDAVLFMGMGEPMHNFEAVCASVEIITHEEGLAFSPRRVVLSTSGEIDRMGEFHRRFPRVRLAISLNAGTDRLRSELIPMNDKFNLAAIAAFIKNLELAKNDMVTFEYVIISDVNDTPEQIRAVVGYLKPLSDRVKVNLIPYNHIDGLDYKSPEHIKIMELQKAIRAIGISAFIRRNRGRGVSAACGQLAGRL